MAKPFFIACGTLAAHLEINNSSTQRPAHRHKLTVPWVCHLWHCYLQDADL